MKVLILGGSGMLGHKLYQVFKDKFDTWITLRDSLSGFAALRLFERNKTLENVNVSDFETFENALVQLKPDVVVNAIGVIKQKSNAKDVIKNIEINALFPHKVANITDSIGARFITLSTDCVFDGQKGFYSETDLPNARDLYGKSKHLGEVLNGNCLTFRTSIIGREINTTNSLVEWFLGNRGQSVRGFSNAIYSGFPTIVLAEILVDIIENKKELKGLYHLSSEPISKYKLLVLIKDKLNLNIEIERFEDFSIDRSLDSRRFREKASFVPDDWVELVRKMLDDPTPYEKWKNTVEIST